MSLIKYIFQKRKMHIFTTILLLVFGIILVWWGIDVHEQIVKNTVLLSIGTSLVAGGIVAILDLFRIASQEQVYNNIDNLIIKAGIDNVYEKRDLDEYDSLIKNARNSIDVLGYSLRAFYQSYKEILLEKSSKHPNFTVRILLIEPDSMSSRYRENNEDGKVTGIYKKSIDVIKEGFANCPNIKIRTIDIPIGNMIYRIDDTMYVGPYFYKRNSKSTHTIKLNKNGWLYEEYQQEFDKMWKDGKE